MIALLDVNVLIALAWPNHVHHEAAWAWFDGRSPTGWATTPVTEIGFVRVSANPSVPHHVRPLVALEVLSRLCQHTGHRFWADGARLVDPPFGLDRLGGHRQVTDLHLVAVARSNGGVLGTFDRGIEAALAEGDRTAVAVIPPR